MSATISARRDALQGLPLPGAHAGLALDVLLKAQGDAAAKSELLDTIAEKCGSNDVYKVAFDRWKSSLVERGATLVPVTTTSPLVIGLGNAAPLEVGLSLHRTYGMPFLPGSALKGLCRRMAKRARLSEGECRYLLGTTSYASGITFWDAWMAPGSRHPFMRDVITVHHPDYYNSQGKNSFPTDFDDPTPIAFLCVKPNTKFWLALSKPKLWDDQWLTVALQLLRVGLESEGLGAKTNAGYGRFQVEAAAVREIVAATSPELPAALERQINNIKGAGDFENVQNQANNLSPVARKHAAELMLKKAKDIGFWKEKNKEKSTYRWIGRHLEDA